MGCTKTTQFKVKNIVVTAHIDFYFLYVPYYYYERPNKDKGGLGGRCPLFSTFAPLLPSAGEASAAEMTYLMMDVVTVT